MSCESVSERLPELLAGALTRDAEAETLAHLAGCQACRGELAFWAQMAEAVNAETAELPDDTVESVRRSLFGEQPEMLVNSLIAVGRALGLAGSACRLVLAVATK